MEREVRCPVKGCRRKFLPSVGHKVSGVIPTSVLKAATKVHLVICESCYQNYFPNVASSLSTTTKEK